MGHLMAETSTPLPCSCSATNAFWLLFICLPFCWQQFKRFNGLAAWQSAKGFWAQRKQVSPRKLISPRKHSRRYKLLERAEAGSLSTQENTAATSKGQVLALQISLAGLFINYDNWPGTKAMVTAAWPQNTNYITKNIYIYFLLLNNLPSTCFFCFFSCLFTQIDFFICSMNERAINCWIYIFYLFIFLLSRMIVQCSNNNMEDLSLFKQIHTNIYEYICFLLNKKRDTW